MLSAIRGWTCAAFLLVLPCGCHEEKPAVAFQVPAREQNRPVLTNAQFSPDGKTSLALFIQTPRQSKDGNGPRGHATRKEFTALYDSTTGKRLADGPRYYTEPPWCPFVPDTTLLVIGKPGLDEAFPKDSEKPVDDRWPLALWDWKTKKVIREFVPPTSHVGSVAVSPDGKRVLTGHWDGRILAWDVATGKQILSFSTSRESELSDGHIPRLFFVNDGSRVIACSRDSIKVLDTLTGKEVGPKFTEYAAAQKTSYHNYSLFSPDGMILCTSLTHADPADPMIRIWDLNSGKLRTQINFKLDTDRSVGAAAFADHGKRLLIADAQGLRFLEVASGKPISAVKVSWVSFSPDGRFVVTDGDNAPIGLWDIAKEKLVWSASAEGSSEQKPRQEKD